MLVPEQPFLSCPVLGDLTQLAGEVAEASQQFAEDLRFSEAGRVWEAEAEDQYYLQRRPDGDTCHFPRPG